MSLTFAPKLGLYMRKTNIGAQKIDDSTFKTFEMMIADFQVEDKGGRPRFFQETFLMADNKFDVILGMLFLKISNINNIWWKNTHVEIIHHKQSSTNHQASPTSQSKRIYYNGVGCR